MNRQPPPTTAGNSNGWNQNPNINGEREHTYYVNPSRLTAPAPIGGHAFHNPSYLLPPLTPTPVRPPSLDSPRLFNYNPPGLNHAQSTSLNMAAAPNPNAFAYNTPLLHTPAPTQSNRYQVPPAPPGPAHRRSLTLDQPEMERFFKLMGNLVDDNLELKRRVSFLETAVFDGQPSTPVRGMAAPGHRKESTAPTRIVQSGSTAVRIAESGGGVVGPIAANAPRHVHDPVPGDSCPDIALTSRKRRRIQAEDEPVDGEGTSNDGDVTRTSVPAALPKDR
ncbi:hypothetical protein C8R45DRAFT_313735 [Mycena sanguinolenta]|nr:hypothetical protein C8R45DRAFT_313735 [Mycena sanguinolenta]